jgi:hypothetical protein
MRSISRNQTGRDAFPKRPTIPTEATLRGQESDGSESRPYLWKNPNIPFAFGHVLEHLPRPLPAPGSSRFTYGDNDRVNS